MADGSWTRTRAHGHAASGMIAPDAGRGQGVGRSISARGFSLVELLVVIAVLAVLISLTLSAGTKVVSVGRERGTQWALQSLDAALGDYIQSSGSIPSATVRDPLDRNLRVPLIDGAVGANASDLRTMNSASWFVYQLQSEGASAVNAINQIDQKLRQTVISQANPAVADETETGVRTTRLLDPWGNPLRYVHPRFAGPVGRGLAGGEQVATVAGNVAVGLSYKWTTFTRDPTRRWQASNGRWSIAGQAEIDAGRTRGLSDGGSPQNRRPYFYSAGPDGDPSTIDDNIYTNRPSFARP